jgi:nucleotide-binding universal stress UspA family protein
MKILVPVDGSSYSSNAIEFIASRSTLIGAQPQVELLNVQSAVPPRAARMVGKSMVDEYYRDEAAKALKPALARLKKAGLEVTGSHRVGHAADQIAAACEKRKDDLIVMGSHGHGAMAGLILGSVTNGVLARTRTPLLVLRSKGAPKGDALKVAIAVDGSKFGLAAAKYVLKHRDLFGAGAGFTLLNVVPDFVGAVMPDLAGVAMPPISAEDIEKMQRDAFEKATEAARKVFEKAQVPVETVRLSGPAGDAIAEHAAKKKVDVLVMGSHGYGAFKSAVLGSVATRVAAHCRTPLLIVR